MYRKIQKICQNIIKYIFLNTFSNIFQIPKFLFERIEYSDIRILDSIFETVSNNSIYIYYIPI